MSEMRFVRNGRGKEQLVIKDAVLRFNNFAGKQTEFNAAGNRNIDVILPDNKMAVEMGENGWNVKIRKPHDPEDDSYYTLNIKINLDSRWPPKIFQHNKRETIELTSLDYWAKILRDECKTAEEFNRRYPKPDDFDNAVRNAMLDAVSSLDNLSLENICMAVNGSSWDSQFGHGIKAYLDELHFRPAPSLFGRYYDNDESELETEDIPF